MPLLGASGRRSKSHKLQFGLSLRIAGYVHSRVAQDWNCANSDGVPLGQAWNCEKQRLVCLSINVRERPDLRVAKGTFGVPNAAHGYPKRIKIRMKIKIRKTIKSRIKIRSTRRISCPGRGPFRGISGSRPIS